MRMSRSAFVAPDDLARTATSGCAPFIQTRLKRSRRNIMTRASAIAAAFVVALALAPISAHAQQIFACVNNSSGTIHIVAQNTPCQNNEMSLAWSAGPGGVLAASDYQCVAGQFFEALSFQLSSTGVSFGSGIGTTGSQFSSFVLQPGIYQFHLSGTQFATPQTPNFVTFAFITARLSSGSVITDVAFWTDTLTPNNGFVDLVGGDRLVSVGQPNTALQFLYTGPQSVQVSICELVITRLQ
jgi:hypothetical protein